MAVHTTQHLVGRLIGASMRRRLRRLRAPGRYPHAFAATLRDRSSTFDPSWLQGADRLAADVEGLGNLAAIAFVLRASTAHALPEPFQPVFAPVPV